jgi:hypothetical protein
LRKGLNLFIEQMISMESLEKITTRQRKFLWAGLGFILILGIFLHRFSTWNWGIGISHDSIFYISASENLLNGNGISQIEAGTGIKPLTHFPPLYPLSLSFMGYFIGVREAADWSASVLFGTNAVLIALVIFQGSMSLWAGLLGGLLALISPLLLDIHFEALSEPLYIATMLTSFILLASFLKHRKSWQLILAAVAASLSYLTRYIGISVLLTGILSLILLYPGTYRTKFRKVSVYGMVAFIPNLIWYVRNYLLTGSLTNRVLAFHPVSQEKLIEGLLSISRWILPGSAPIGLALGMVAFVALTSTLGFLIKPMDTKTAYRDETVVRVQPILKVIVIYIILYLALLFISLTFFDISTRLDNRILVPFYVMFLMLSIISIQRFLVTSRLSLRKALLLISAALFAWVLIAYVPRSWELIRVMRQEGIGYSSTSWRNSEIIAVLRRLDSGAIIYSNEAFPLYYLTGIEAYGIPEKLDPVKSEEREDFQQGLDIMRERLRNPNSALVVFHQGYLREGMPTLNEIAQGFVIAHESRDGVIFVDPDYLDDWRNVLP